MPTSCSRFARRMGRSTWLEQLAGFTGIVVDANAISPETAMLVGGTVIGAGAR